MTRVVVRVVALGLVFGWSCCAWQPHAGSVTPMIHAAARSATAWSSRSSTALASTPDSDDDVRARLREESEAPGQTLLLTAYSVGGAGGLASGFIALTQLAAGTLPLTQAGINIAVDVAVVAASALLWRGEQEKRARRLARVKRGGELAALKVRGSLGLGTVQTVPLAALRRERSVARRVVIVAGKSLRAVQPTLDAARRAADDLMSAELLLVPVILGTPPDDLVQAPFVAWPVLGEQWTSVMNAELEEAQAQGAVLDGEQPQAVVIILKKNGRVGQRGLTPSGGALPWEVLVRDVRNREEAGMDVTNI